jgi:hypothetical protein
LCTFVDEVLDESLVIRKGRKHQGRPSFLVRLVDVGTELHDQASSHIEVACPGSSHQGRGPTLIRLIDIGTEVFHQTTHDIQVAIIGCNH